MLASAIAILNVFGAIYEDELVTRLLTYNMKFSPYWRLFWPRAVYLIDIRKYTSVFMCMQGYAYSACDINFVISIVHVQPNFLTAVTRAQFKLFGPLGGNTSPSICCTN